MRLVQQPLAYAFNAVIAILSDFASISFPSQAVGIIIIMLILILILLLLLLLLLLHRRLRRRIIIIIIVVGGRVVFHCIPTTTSTSLPPVGALGCGGSGKGDPPR